MLPKTSKKRPKWGPNRIKISVFSRTAPRIDFGAIWDRLWRLLPAKGESDFGSFFDENMKKSDFLGVLGATRFHHPLFRQKGRLHAPPGPQKHSIFIGGLFKNKVSRKSKKVAPERVRGSILGAISDSFFIVVGTMERFWSIF